MRQANIYFSDINQYLQFNAGCGSLNPDNRRETFYWAHILVVFLSCSFDFLIINYIPAAFVPHNWMCPNDPRSHAVGGSFAPGRASHGRLVLGEGSDKDRFTKTPMTSN